jgi:pentatricopeptide repeat protein
MILGNVKCGLPQKHWNYFNKCHVGLAVQLDPVTFVGVLNASAGVIALDEGRCSHDQIIQGGCDLNVFVGSSLVDICAKFGSMEDAWRVFNKMPFGNVVSWAW